MTSKLLICILASGKWMDSKAMNIFRVQTAIASFVFLSVQGCFNTLSLAVCTDVVAKSWTLLSVATHMLFCADCAYL